MYYIFRDKTRKANSRLCMRYMNSWCFDCLETEATTLPSYIRTTLKPIPQASVYTTSLPPPQRITKTREIVKWQLTHSPPRSSIHKNFTFFLASFVKGVTITLNLPLNMPLYPDKSRKLQISITKLGCFHYLTTTTLSRSTGMVASVTTWKRNLPSPF